MASVELYSGTDPQVLEYSQHATPGSFKAGDLVTVDNTGLVKIATAAVTFLGIARKDADTIKGYKIPVELIDPHAIYTVRWSTTGTVTATSTTQIGDAVGFVFTAGAHVVSDSLTASAYTVGLDPRDASTGIAGGRLLIRFYGTALTAQY